MNIKQKLQINSLVILTLLAINAAVTVFLTYRIAGDVRELVEVQAPLERAILEIEINVGDTARAVIDYIRDHEPQSIERMRDSARDIERFKQALERLAATEEERALAQKVTAFYAEFKLLGEELMSVSARHFAELKLFRNYVKDIDALIKDELQPAVEPSDPEVLLKVGTALDMEVKIGAVRAAVEGYVLQPDPEFRESIASSQVAFGRFKARFLGTRLSAEEEKWLDAIGAVFAKAAKSADVIVALTDRIRADRARFEEQHEIIDRILDDEVQALIHENVMHAANEARDSVAVAPAITGVVGILVFASLTVMSWLVSKSIGDGVERLRKGVAEFGRGDLDTRVETRTEDEFGELAAAFNRMAERRKTDEENLRHGRERLQAVLDTATDGVITIDHRGIVQTYNTGAERIFGYRAEEVIGNNISMLMPENDARAHDGYIERYLESGSRSPVIGATRDLWGLRKDGTTFPLELAVSEMKFVNERMFTGIVRDISERVQTEAELRWAREQAELASRSKSEFLANMSHELRTPLNAIIGFSEMIRAGTFGPLGNVKYGEYVKDINMSGEHLLGLINDILDLSKIEAGKTELHEDNVDVAAVIKSCVTLVKERAKDGGVKLEREMRSDYPVLCADERKLKQILINLLANAVKFTPAGGTVTIRVWSNMRDGFVFQVADTGIGIALEDVAKALAPFSQIESDLGRKYDGTGLGLPLTKALVEAHSGSLDLRSGVDKGTTVTVRFPPDRIRESEDHEAPPAMEHSA